MRAALRHLRERARDCSVRTAFVLYAAGAILAALVLSFVSTGLLGLLTESTLPESPYAYSGVYVLDAERGQLVPAEALSWYEMAAYDAVVEGDAAGEDALVLYVASRASSERESISLDDPPAGAGAVTDLATMTDDVEGPSLGLADLASYDEAATAARPGADAAAALSAELPANAEGERPIVSNVGYYLPYPGDHSPYRALAWTAVASVPLVFVACLVVAGRRFYRARLAGPISAMDEAARRIAASDLDFSVGPQRSDELGRLCEQFEAMRTELARTEGELWRAAESRRRVNAAFAHDLRTPLTVIRGQAELIGRMAEDDDVRGAATAIERQAERLSAFAESMRGLDALEAAEVAPTPMDPGTWLADAAADAREAVRAAGVALRVDGRGLPPLVMADPRALARIADNLVANAARYARSEVRLSLSWANGELELAVADDEPGFADTALERATEPFWGDSKGGGGHLGLGLYVSRLLAEKHGGSLDVSNGGASGAIVRATLSAPVAQGNPESN